MTDDIIEGYLRELDAALAAEPEEKRQIVDEIRGHLEEKVADHAARHPERDAGAIARDVIHDFGNPHDLALAYRGERAVILNRAGDVVLRLSRAVGRRTRAVIERAQQDDVKRALRGAGTATGHALDRAAAGARRALAAGARVAERAGAALPPATRALGRGVRRAVKWTGVTLVVLVVLALVLAVVAFHTVLPVVAKNVPYALYSSTQHCDDGNCTLRPVTQVFHVHPEAREVRLSLDAWSTDRGNGTAHVVVRAPDERTVYDRELGAGTVSRLGETIGWPAVPGNWTVAVAYDDFSGWLTVRVDAVGLPPDRLWFP